MTIETPTEVLPLSREDSYGVRTELPEQFLGAGAYSASSTGGSDFPAFTASLQANPAPLVDETVEYAFGRYDDSEILWTGGAPDDDLVIWSQTFNGAIDLVCRTRVGDGTFTVPRELLANMREGAGIRTLAVGTLRASPLEFETDGPERGLLLYREQFLFDVFPGSPQLASTPVVLPDGTEIQVEVAANFSERQRGLMFRDFMPADQGMLFLFSSTATWRFWMLNTYISLDILWLNEEREIIFISANTPPCPSGNSCPTYGPNEPSRFVLELNAGEAANRGLKVGDRLDW